ncbi:hypothetical protein [Streptomyces zaomyceticus]|uniref:Uncharacterized protein n=1 Tax=Streptomyces zaomyceticus TaxID=68286 RepID=A0ABZ1LDQ4_9ACTN
MRGGGDGGVPASADLTPTGRPPNAYLGKAHPPRLPDADPGPRLADGDADPGPRLSVPGADLLAPHLPDVSPASPPPASAFIKT